MGTALRTVQKGQTPESAKPLATIQKGVSGVLEIVCDFNKDTYRSVYVARLKSGVYALDAFQKKSTQGIATPQRIVERIAERYAKAVEEDERINKGGKE